MATVKSFLVPKCSKGLRDNRRVVGSDVDFQSTHQCEDGLAGDTAGAWELFAVLDGHDGLNAVEHFKKHLLASLAQMIKSDRDQNFSKESIVDVFGKADDDFFNGLEAHISKRETLVSKLQNLNSFEAYLQYPLEVQQLQEIDQCISGGTTAAVAMVNGNSKTLWVANVGDSRVLLFSGDSDDYKQLTVDHTTSNEAELDRLEVLGLDRNALAKNGRLGSCENTRSLGDFCLKQGYREVDSLQHAKECPGIAEPYVQGPVSLSFGDVIVLMTDGVFNTANHVLEGEYPVNLRELIKEKKYNAQSVVDTIGEKACEVYKANVGKQDEDSLKKVTLTRKQDDMAMAIISFAVETSC